MAPRPLPEIERELRSYACRDGGCAVLRPTGMHTNGGCRCVRNLIELGEPSGRNRLERVLNLHQERFEALKAEPPLGHRFALVRAVRDLVQALERKRTNDGDRLRIAEALAVVREVEQ